VDESDDEEEEDDEEEYEDIASDDEDEEEEGEEDENTENKITVKQITEALKRRGYNEVDFITVILEDLYHCNRIQFPQGPTLEERSNNLIYTIDSILDGEISVDHRDSRTYASVLLGEKKNDEAGAGPKPIVIKNDVVEVVDVVEVDQVDEVVEVI
jgi:hypothetical protein